MLLHHSATNSERVAAHPFYHRFRQNLAAVGNWPQQCRRVAIVNGNRVGKLKTLQPNHDGAAPIHPEGTLLNFAVHRKHFGWCNIDIACKKLKVLVYAHSDHGRSRASTLTVSATNLILLLSAVTPLPFYTKDRYAVHENGTSPFHRVIAPDYDTYHVTVDPTSANGFFDEIFFPKPIPTCNACPDYLSLAAPEPANVEFRAARAITLQPSFSAGPGTHAEFALGDANGNAGTWHRATYGDSGWEITLPNGGGTQKFFARSKGNHAVTIQGWLSFCN